MPATTLKIAGDSNRSPSINFLSGINGIAAGGTPTLNLGSDRRYLGMKLQCAAVNYTGGNALPTKKLTGGGNNDLTINVVVSTAGLVTAATVAAGGTGYANGDTFNVVDATGAGLVFTVATSNAGVVATVTFNIATATPTPMNPVQFFDSLSPFNINIGGTPVRSLIPLSMLMIAQARGRLPFLGELPIDFVEPDRNFLKTNDSTAWDMIDQPAFDLSMKIAGGLLLPTLTGSQKFDTLRNAYSDKKGNPVAIVDPIWHKEQSVAVAQGSTDITTIKFNGALQRAWLIGTTPGAITRLEVYQDTGKKRLEASTQQIQEFYAAYGIQLGQANYANQNFAGSNALKAQYNPITYFDTAYLPDVDGRLSDKLLFSSLMFRVFSNVAQNVKFVIESSPGVY
jgi:hypothetical protein